VFEGEPITKVVVILEKRGAVVGLEGQNGKNLGAAYFPDSTLASEVAASMAIFFDKVARRDPDHPPVQLVREDFGLAEQVELVRINR